VLHEPDEQLPQELPLASVVPVKYTSPPECRVKRESIRGAFRRQCGQGAPSLAWLIGRFASNFVLHSEHWYS